MYVIIRISIFNKSYLKSLFTIQNSDKSNNRLMKSSYKIHLIMNKNKNQIKF